MQAHDRPLVDFRVCVADAACVRLDLSVPETREIDHSWANATTYYESGPYRLVIDGFIYGEEEYSFGGRWTAIATAPPPLVEIALLRKFVIRKRVSFERIHDNRAQP